MTYLLKYWQYLVIASLVLLLFIKSQDNEKIIYQTPIKIYKDKIVNLEKIKEVEKIKIVTVIKEVKEKVAAVDSLNTKEIANYYQKRYKLPVTITQYGVALKDTVAKLNIVELIQKDGLLRELSHTKNILNITETQSKIKDSIIDNHITIEKNLTNSVKSEKAKKTFWQIVSGGILVGAGYLLIR